MKKKHRASAMAGIAGLGLALAAPALAQSEFGSPELIAAAKKEGKLIYYTANFAEVEQEVIKEFNKRFPEIKVEMVRAPGGQLITRIKTEAAAGKLVADVVDHSDRALMLPLVDLFQDYAPPNAADYNPDAQISPKLWPRATLVWSIAYNTELVKNPPKTWMDLTKPEYDKMTGQVFAQSGGTTWTRIMFERQVLGEDYWKKQAATHPILYPSGAPMSDSMVRGEIAMGPLLYNAIYPKQKDGAPVKIFFPPEGVPVNPVRDGNSEDGGASQRRQAVPELVPVERGPDLHDQGARQPHLAQGAAGLSRRLRSQGGQGLVPEVRRVREAARAVGRGMGQDLRLSPVSVAHVKPK